MLDMPTKHVSSGHFIKEEKGKERAFFETLPFPLHIVFCLAVLLGRIFKFLLIFQGSGQDYHGVKIFKLELSQQSRMCLEILLASFMDFLSEEIWFWLIFADLRSVEGFRTH